MTVELKSLTSLRTWDHDTQLTCCRFSPDKQHIVAAGHDGRLHLFHLDGKEPESIEAHRGWVEGLEITTDRTLLISADSWGQIRAWRWTEGKLDRRPVWTVTGACGSWLRDLAISPDGSSLAVCGNEPIVRVFAVADGRLLHELRGHTQPVMSVAFSPDSKDLVSGDLHGRVRDWNLADGQCRRQFAADRLFKTFYHYRQGGIRVMAIDAAGKTLYCAGFEGTNANQAQGKPLVLTFDWQNGQPAATLTAAPESNGPITDLALHPDGFVVAAGSSEAGGTLWFWRAGEEASTHHVKHGTSFRRFTIDSDGQRLAAATFGSLTGQRGGNGRRLDEQGHYLDFGGSLALYQWK